MDSFSLTVSDLKCHRGVAFPLTDMVQPRNDNDDAASWDRDVHRSQLRAETDKTAYLSKCKRFVKYLKILTRELWQMSIIKYTI